MRCALALGCFATGVLVLNTVTPAGAFVPIQTKIADAAAVKSDIIQVRSKTARLPGLGSRP